MHLTRIFSFLSLILFASTAHAENFKIKYYAEWNNVRVGEMTIISNEMGGNYEYKALINSAGLLKTFTNYKSQNVANGKIGKDGLIPETYKTHWIRKKEDQTIDVVYKNKGKEPVETANPPEKRWKRPEVPAKYKNNTFDPVTAALDARRQIMELVQSGAAMPSKIKIPVFDARRRFDVDLTVNGYKNKKLNGEDRQLLEIVFFRSPINGFNEKELKRMQMQDPTITFYLDENFIPVMGSGAAPFGQARFVLAEYCTETSLACDL